MGKKAEHTKHLREQRALNEQRYSSQMALFGNQMDDVYKRYNEQHHALEMSTLDRQIRQAEAAAQQEQIEEMTQSILAQLSQDGQTIAKDIATEIQKALKSIRL